VIQNIFWVWYYIILTDSLVVNWCESEGKLGLLYLLVTTPCWYQRGVAEVYTDKSTLCCNADLCYWINMSEITDPWQTESQLHEENNTYHSETVKFFTLSRLLSLSLLHRNVPSSAAKIIISKLHHTCMLNKSASHCTVTAQCSISVEIFSTAAFQ